MTYIVYSVHATLIMTYRVDRVHATPIWPTELTGYVSPWYDVHSWQGARHPDMTCIVDRVYYPDITYIVDSTCHPDMTYKIDKVHVTLICMFTKMLYSTWLTGYMQ